MYRRYVTLHSMATTGAFAIAAVWIIISASRHSVAESKCESDFFGAAASSGPTASEGGVLCNIFPWVDVGIMGGLWVFFAITQVHLIIVIPLISSDQILFRYTFTWSFRLMGHYSGGTTRSTMPTTIPQNRSPMTSL